MFQKRTRLEIVLFSIWFLDILAASLMLSSKRLNENYNDISVRFDKLDYFSLLLLRLEIWGFQKLSLYFSFAAFYTVYILCDFPIRSGTTRSQFFIWCCARDAFILLCFLALAGVFLAGKLWSFKIVMLLVNFKFEKLWTKNMNFSW